MRKKSNKNSKIEILMLSSSYAISKYDLEGDIYKAIEHIKDIPNRLAEAHPNHSINQAHKYIIRVESVTDYGCDNVHDEYYVDVYRWETDEELALRLKTNKRISESIKEKAAIRKVAEEKRQKTLYETLKKKFEK